MYGNKKMSGQDIHNFFEKHLPDIFKHLIDNANIGEGDNDQADSH